MRTDRQTSRSYQSLFEILRTSLNKLKLRNWISLNQEILRIKIRILIKNLSVKLTQGLYTVLAALLVGKRAKALSHYLWKSSVTYAVKDSKAE